MRSGVKDLFSVLCSVFCTMAIVSTYLAVTHGSWELQFYGIGCFLVGAIVGFAVLMWK